MFSIILMLFTRVHIGIILIFVYLLNFFIKSKINLKTKYLIFSILALAFFVIVNKLLTGSIIDFKIFDIFYEISSTQRLYSINFNSYYNSADFNSIYLILWHLFYPLIQFNSYSSFAISIENLINLVFVVSLIYLLIITSIKKVKLDDSFFLILFSILVIIVLSHFISVSAINLRQKWIYLPFLLVLFFQVYSKYKNE